MSDKLWYYTQEGSQHGPVSLTELREMGASARLLPGDLIWQPGMESWTPASSVDGVISQSPHSPPPLAGPPSPPALAKAAGPSPLEERGRAFFNGAAAHARRLGRAGEQSETLPHVRLMGRLLGYLANIFSESFLDQVDRISKRVGHLAYFTAAILYLVFYISVAIKNDSMQIFFMAAAIILPVAMVGQFTAVKFLDAGARLIPNLPSRLFSGTFLQCAGLLSFTAALVPLIMGIYTLIQASEWIGFAIALASTATLAYMGAVCLNPSSVNVSVDEEAGPGEEALGILSFGMKVLLRLLPVYFGVGAVAGVGIAVLLIIKLISDDYTAIVFAVVGNMSAVDLTGRVLALGFIPFLAYLGFVFFHLFVDVARAILGVPGKLEVLSRAMDKG